MRMVLLLLSFATILIPVCSMTGAEINPSQLRRRRTKRLTTGVTSDENLLFSSTVSIRSRTPYAFMGDNHFCAGTIITEIFVLTTARCVVNEEKIPYRPRQLLVTAGTRERTHLPDSAVNFPVKSVIVHENYSLYNTHDLAIVRLKYAIPEDNQFIDLIFPGFDPPPIGETCTALGWGRMFEDGPLSDEILYANLTILSLEACNDTFDTFVDGMICAAPTDKEISVGACPGDTGGPLFCGEKLYGLISYTTGCTRPGYPTIFTSTYYYSDWIQEEVESGCKQLFIVSVWICILSLTLNIFYVGICKC